MALTIFGQPTSRKSSKFLGISPDLMVTDIQGFLGDVNLVVKALFFG